MITKSKKNRKIAHFSDIFFSVLLGILVLIILGFLIITNIKIEQRRKTLLLKIENLKKEVQNLEEKNEKLKTSISQAGTLEYLEKIAREQFNLKAPGEEKVVILKVKKEEEKKEEVNSQEEKKNIFNPLNWWGLIKSNF